MIVSEVINKIMEINEILDQYNKNPNGMTKFQLETAMDCIKKYRDILMGMDVCK